MITDEALANIEKRHSKTSKGPWISYIEGKDHQSGTSFIMTGVKQDEDIWNKNRGTDIELSGATIFDIEFIAHCKQDIPMLIKEIRRLMTP